MPAIGEAVNTDRTERTKQVSNFANSYIASVNLASMRW